MSKTIPPEHFLAIPAAAHSVAGQRLLRLLAMTPEERNAATAPTRDAFGPEARAAVVHRMLGGTLGRVSWLPSGFARLDLDEARIGALSTSGIHLAALVLSSTFQFILGHNERNTQLQALSGPKNGAEPGVPFSVGGQAVADWLSAPQPLWMMVDQGALYLNGAMVGQIEFDRSSRDTRAEEPGTAPAAVTINVTHAPTERNPDGTDKQSIADWYASIAKEGGPLSMRLFVDAGQAIESLSAAASLIDQAKISNAKITDAKAGPHLLRKLDPAATMLANMETVAQVRKRQIQAIIDQDAANVTHKIRLDGAIRAAVSRAAEYFAVRTETDAAGKKYLAGIGVAPSGEVVNTARGPAHLVTDAEGNSSLMYASLGRHPDDIRLSELAEQWCAPQKPTERDIANVSVSLAHYRRLAKECPGYRIWLGPDDKGRIVLHSYCDTPKPAHQPRPRNSLLRAVFKRLGLPHQD